MLTTQSTNTNTKTNTKRPKRPKRPKRKRKKYGDDVITGKPDRKRERERVIKTRDFKMAIIYNNKMERSHQINTILTPFLMPTESLVLQLIITTNFSTIYHLQPC